MSLRKKLNMQLKLTLITLYFNLDEDSHFKALIVLLT
jgi:hypothetical protein